MEKKFEIWIKNYLKIIMMINFSLNLFWLLFEMYF
jgi:hypothetical protein